MIMTLKSFAFLVLFTIVANVLDLPCIVSAFNVASNKIKRTATRRTFGCNKNKPQQSSHSSSVMSAHHDKIDSLQIANVALVETKQVQLSQVSAEIMICQPLVDDSFSPSSSSSLSNGLHRRPPLLFLHGSFHSSWCWAEHYMPYFASHGYSCYALSLRGTGGTFAGEGVKKVKIDQHVQDITDMIAYIHQQEQAQQKGETAISDDDLECCRSVLIAHSFGGLAVMKYLENILLTVPSKNGDDEEDNATTNMNNHYLKISGVVSMCSVPPSGNGKMTMRFLKRSLRDSWKITAGLAMKKCIRDKALCRELFFEDDVEGISEDDISRFQTYFERDTVATIDLMDLAKKLPSVHTNDSGKAIFWEDGHGAAPMPALVIGATDDFIVDKEGVDEMARYYGVSSIMVNSAHDVMLGSKWENGAKEILGFLEQKFPAKN